MVERALSWDSPSLGKLRRASLFNVHVGITQEGQGKKKAEVPSLEWSTSSLLLVSSFREALPRDQLPLGTPAREVIFERCHVAWQTATIALPIRILKGTQRERQGWAVVSNTVVVMRMTVMRGNGGTTQSTLILAPEAHGFQSQPHH